MKHRKSKRKLNDKQALVVIISVACAAALLIGALVIIGPILGGNSADPHAGHDHSNSNLGDGHYEGDGHDHGTPSANSNAKVTYQIYTNADKTSRLVFRGSDNKVVAEFDNLKVLDNRSPMVETIDADKGVYSLAWATGQGPNDYEQVYYNEKTGQVSQKFRAPRGCDGVRIAYGNDNQDKIIVQDLFDKNAYYKEHALPDAATGEGDIIMGGALQKDKKTVMISYKDETGTSRHTAVNLYA